MPKPEETEGQEQFPVTLEKIVTAIGNRTGHDFSAYKKSALIRGILRRMKKTRLLSRQKKLNCLHHDPAGMPLSLTKQNQKS
jgi:chemotaxis methyl-accepting protein methylase